MIISSIYIKRREGKSRRDDPLLTVDAIYGKEAIRTAPKSRRDDPLLTDGFNRRMPSNARSLQSPARTILDISANCRPFGTLTPYASSAVRRLKPSVNKGSSLRDWGVVHIMPLVRRLKPSVNKVASLRDFSPPTLPLQVVNFSSLKNNS